MLTPDTASQTAFRCLKRMFGCKSPIRIVFSLCGTVPFFFYTGCDAQYKSLQSRAIYTAGRSGLEQKACPDNSVTFLNASISQLLNNFLYLKKNTGDV